jgi:uncharacterized protein YgiM (DUF1202 family)
LLIVRAGPGTDYQRLGAIDSGQVYPIQDEVNGWFQNHLQRAKGLRFVKNGQNAVTLCC